MVILLCVIFSSCGKGDNISHDTHPFAPEVTSETAVEYDESRLLAVDESWQGSYALSYDYYDSKTAQKSTITEAKCGSLYQSVDEATNTICYLTESDGSILEYMLSGKSLTGTVTVAGVGTVSDTSSGFCLLSKVDRLFPQYKNVTKVGTDYVAKRPATRYKQVEKSEQTSGEFEGDTSQTAEEKIAYVWIDDEYGFASRCELYDAKSQKLIMSWVLTGFNTGIEEKDVKIDLTKFKIESK